MSSALALTPEDAAMLHQLEAQPRPIDRVRQKHHLLARYIAKGYGLGEAALLAGYGTGTARQLELDPTFQELVRYYSLELEPFKEQMVVKLQAISMEAADEILDRLDDHELRTKMPTKQLEALVTLGTDRLGLPPKQAAQELNVNVNIATRLEAARKRVESRLIEHEAQDVPVNSDS